MAEPYRMRIKIGAHEFEAEGPVDVVQEQVKRFMGLLASLPVEYVANPYGVPKDVGTPIGTPSQPASVPATPITPDTDSALSKIMKLENRVVSLTVRPRNAEDAVLLVLYGQKALRENESVTGAEVMEGITATGGLSVLRVDRLLEGLARAGDVIVIGERRGKRYRLTNAGLTKARLVASDLLAIVA